MKINCNYFAKSKNVTLRKPYLKKVTKNPVLKMQKIVTFSKKRKL